MASNQTSNYKLNQWAAEDRIIREEFNTDNQKIETALSGLSTEMGKRATQTALNNLSTTLNSTISTGLSKKYGTDNAYIKSGSYTGTGTATITINTGFKPSLVMVFCLYGEMTTTDFTLMIGDGSVQHINTKNSSIYVETTALQMTNTGFTVSYQRSEDWGFNTSGRPYRYIAFR